MQNRRSFLRHVLGATGLFILKAQASPPGEPDWISVGGVEEFEIDVPKVLSEEGAIVVRRKSGIQAMSLFCTHRGCPLGVADDNTLHCNCHGAEFDTKGNVLKGPAKTPLPEVPVRVIEGEVQVLNAER